MIGRLLSYIEIKTKITSLFAFLMTLAFLMYKDEAIDWKRTGVFFVAMFVFDLVTTAINNYIDTKTNDQELQFERTTARRIIWILLGISIGLGLYLAYLTDIVILLVGGVCFLCGIFYTYGPVPISRQPLGELLSGIFYGLLIPFILLYINLPPGALLTLTLGFKTISISFEVAPLLTVLLFSIVPVCATANIMLANNICDLEKDVAVKRHTLPYYLGDKALYLYAGMYYLAYLAIVVMVVFRILSPICLVAIITLMPVQKNIGGFLKKQEKETTFIYSIQNYVMIMGATTLLIFISALLG